MTGDSAIVLVDPTHDYAVRFIELAAQRHDCRAICIYRHSGDRAAALRRFPILGSNAVVASHEIRDGAIAAVVPALAAHRPRAVVPFNEEVLAASCQLSECLNLEWNDPIVMRRFRDKFSFKQFLRATHPRIRMNHSSLIAGARELTSLREEGFGRVVLKPNDGYGNRDIGIFDLGVSIDPALRFLEARTGRRFVAEEYVGGIEYFVNGQVDAGGNAHVVAIFEYSRTHANGREGIDLATRLVHTGEAAFRVAAEYAVAVMEASGLRRSPFHVELKIDERGPCLIEAAARLAGNRNAFLCNEVHGGALDLLGVALSDYLGVGRSEAPVTDWGHYDSRQVQYVHGIATSKEIVVELEGVEAVEALPSFNGWARKPQLGDRITPTVDALTMPFSVVLASESPAEVAADSERVRQLIRWNRSVGLVRRTAARAMAAGETRYQNLRGKLPPVVEPTLLGALSDLAGVTANVQRNVAHKLRALARRAQQQGIGRQALSLAEPLSARHVEQAAAVLAWARDYLGEPHPDLGRRGPVCPFARRSLAEDLFSVAFHDELDGTSCAAMRDVVLNHTQAFLTRFPATARDGQFAALIIVLSGVPEHRLKLLDEVQDELKTQLMTDGLMISTVHRRCERPALANARFAVSRAPFTAFALRHMVVQDIAFVGHNGVAFQAFRARFGQLFRQDKVSNEFGYVDRFREAEARFGSAS